MQILQTLFTLFSASRMSNSNSPIKYKSTFLSKDLETVLLQQEFQQGGVKKYKVPKYTGQEGLEAIIHCNNRFDRAAEKLSWDSEDRFDNYDEIFEDEALNYWINDVRPSYPDRVDRTEETFREAMGVMVTQFCGGSKTRDYIIEEIRTRCKKPKDVTINKHILRLRHLMTIANLTNGSEEELTEKQLKKILLTTLPKDMQTNWINTGREITEASYDEIQTYFNAQKVQMDSAVDKSGGNNYNKFSTGGRGRGRYNSNPGRGRGNDRGSRKRGGYSQSNNGKSNLCQRPEHAHISKDHQHQWKDCILNQHSRNYRGESTGRGAGRGGRGRGNGGRYTYNRNTSQSQQQQQHESHQHDNSNQSTSTTSNNATQPAEESHAFDMIGGMHNAAEASSNGGWNCNSYNSKHGASS